MAVMRVDRQAVRRRIRTRIRGRVSGTSERPRLSVFRSLKHIYAQAVDDTRGLTLAAASTVDPELKGQVAAGGNVNAAKAVGAAIAERLLAGGCTKVVFDRSGYLYHGRVKALAEAARAKGLQF